MVEDGMLMQIAIEGQSHGAVDSQAPGLPHLMKACGFKGLVFIQFVDILIIYLQHKHEHIHITLMIVVH